MPALAAWCILAIPSSVIKLLTPMLVWCPQTKRRPALLHHPRVLRTMKSVWACNHVQIGHLIFFFSLPLLYMQIENHIWTPFFPILSSFSLYFPAILSFNEKQCTYCSEWFSLHSFSLSPLLFLIAFLFSIPFICHFSLYETKIILKKEKIHLLIQATYMLSFSFCVVASSKYCMCWNFRHSFPQLVHPGKRQRANISKRFASFGK